MHDIEKDDIQGEHARELRVLERRSCPPHRKGSGETPHTENEKGERRRAVHARGWVRTSKSVRESGADQHQCAGERPPEVGRPRGRHTSRRLLRCRISVGARSCGLHQYQLVRSAWQLTAAWDHSAAVHPGAEAIPTDDVGRILHRELRDARVDDEGGALEQEITRQTDVRLNRIAGCSRPIAPPVGVLRSTGQVDRAARTAWPSATRPAAPHASGLFRRLLGPNNAFKERAR